MVRFLFRSKKVEKIILRFGRNKNQVTQTIAKRYYSDTIIYFTSLDQLKMVRFSFKSKNVENITIWFRRNCTKYTVWNWPNARTRVFVGCSCFYTRLLEISGTKRIVISGTKTDNHVWLQSQSENVWSFWQIGIKIGEYQISTKTVTVLVNISYAPQPSTV